MVIEFQFKREVSDDFMQCIFNTMCEGGSVEYWADPDESKGDFKEYHESSDGMFIISVRIIETEVVMGQSAVRSHTVDGQVIRDGIERLLTGAVHLNMPDLGRLLYAIVEDDADQIDGDLVDSVVQAGLYNDIVFG